MRSAVPTLVSAALALALVATGCKDPVTCGDGTVQSNGRCVPASLLTCGAGTLEQAGRCVPAVTLTCGEGTIERDGQCVAQSELTCGAGTEERDGACVVLDPLRRVTVPESPEAANQQPARFDLPALGAPPAVLGGNVGPVKTAADGSAAPDLDLFVFTAEAGTRILLKGTAVGVPSVGLAMQPLDEDLPFARFALTTDARGAQRELVIPVTGDWVLVASDQGNLAGGLPVGNKEFTYTVDVSRLEQPAPTPLLAGVALSGDYPKLAPLALDVPEATPLFDIVLDEPADPGFPGQRALWALGPDSKLLLNAEDENFYGYLFPMEPVRLALPAGRTTFTVDYVYALGANLPQWKLHADPVPLIELASLPHSYNERQSLEGTGNDVFAFDATAGTLATFDVAPWNGSGIVPAIELRDRQWELVQTVRGTHLAQYIPPQLAGRYFVVVKDLAFRDGKTNLDYNLLAHVDAVTTLGPLSTGGHDSTTGSFPATGNTLYAVFAGNDAKVTLTLSPAATADGKLSVYPASTHQLIGESAAGGAGVAEQVAGVVVPSGGLVLAQVSGDADASFTLDVSAEETTTQWETEPNNSQTRANTLVLDTAHHAELAGTLRGDDDDWFNFSVIGAARTMTLATRPGITGAKTDTILSIVRADGTVLIQNDDVGGGQRSSQVSMQLSAGKYAAHVERGYSTAAPWDGDDYVLVVNP